MRPCPLFFALGMLQVRHASLTFDEGRTSPSATPAATGDLRLQPVHIHHRWRMCSLQHRSYCSTTCPTQGPSTVGDASLSAVTDAVVWSYPEPRRIAMAGRVPILLLGVLTGALVCSGRVIRGGDAGLLALCLCALDPIVIAHAALITTVTAAVLLTLATPTRSLGSSGHRGRGPSFRQAFCWAWHSCQSLALMLVPVSGCCCSWTPGSKGTRRSLPC